jgi:transposase
LAWIVEPQAGIPVLMQPLSGHRSDGKVCGQVLSDHIAQCQTTYSPTSLVADSALYNAANLHKLAKTSLKWMTRVPATLTAAQAVCAQAPPATMAALPHGSRDAVVTASYGGVAHRWVLCYSEQRQPQAQRTVETQWRTPSDQEGKAFKALCRTALACEAEAQQARTSFGAGLPTTLLHASTVGPTSHYGQRGRPGPGAQPDPIVYHIPGALASRLLDRRARVDQQSCFILATHALDEGQ